MTRSKQDKLRALALTEVRGSAHAASEETGIPERTIRKWREDGATDPEIAAKVRDAVTEFFQEAALKEAEIAGLANNLVEANLRRMVQKGVELSPAELQRVRLVGAIAGTKLREAIESLARQEAALRPRQPVKEGGNVIEALLRNGAFGDDPEGQDPSDMAGI